MMSGTCDESFKDFPNNLKIASARSRGKIENKTQTQEDKVNLIVY